MEITKVLPAEIIYRILKILYEQDDIASILHFLCTSKTIYRNKIFSLNIPHFSVTPKNISSLRYICPYEISLNFRYSELQKQKQKIVDTLFLKRLMNEFQRDIFKTLSIFTSNYFVLVSLLQALNKKYIEDLFILNEYIFPHNINNSLEESEQFHTINTVNLSKIRVKNTIQFVCDERDKIYIISPKVFFNGFSFFNMRQKKQNTFEIFFSNLKCKSLVFTEFILSFANISEIVQSNNRFKTLAFYHCHFSDSNIANSKFLIGKNTKEIILEKIDFPESDTFVFEGITSPLYLNLVNFLEIPPQRKFKFSDVIIIKDIIIKNCKDLSLTSENSNSIIKNLLLITTTPITVFTFYNLQVNFFIVEIYDCILNIYFNKQQKNWIFKIFGSVASVFISSSDNEDENKEIHSVDFLEVDMESGDILSLNSSQNIEFKTIRVNIKVEKVNQEEKVQISLRNVKCNKFLICLDPPMATLPLKIIFEDSEIKKIKEKGNILRIE